MLDLRRLTIRDMISCGAALREIGRSGACLREVAQEIARWLYARLGDGGGPACPLVRVFATRSADRLGPELHQFVRTVFPRSDGTASNYLVLVGSAGDRPEWNRVEASRRHRALPMTWECIEEMPMISCLLQHLGVDVGALVEPSAGVLVDPSRRTYNVFHVPVAEGSPFMPAQRDFVVPCGIRSALGFGGVLPSGNLFTAIVFSRVPISRETAGLFRVIAISAKLALAPFDAAWAGGPSEQEVQRLRDRLLYTEELVEAFEQTQCEQSDLAERTLERIERMHESATEINAFIDSILENIPDMVFVKDASDLRFSRVNRAAEALLGLSREEMIGRTDYDFFPKAEADFFTATDRAVLASGKLADVTEEPVHPRGGGLRWLHTKKVPILDRSGTPKYLLGIAEDITARRRLEGRRRVLAALGSVSIGADEPDAMLSSLASFALPEIADACVVRLMPDQQSPSRTVAVGESRETCSALRRLAGEGSDAEPELSALAHTAATGQPLLVQQLDEVTAPLVADDPADAQALVDLGVRSILVVPLVARERSLGSVALFYVGPGRQYAPDDVPFALEFGQCAAHVIDNVKLYARSQEAIGIRDQFLSIASHELRTPLTTLLLTLQALQRTARQESVDDRVAAKLDATVRHAHRLSGLIDALLDASRITRGRLAIERERVDLVKIVRDVLDRHREQARAGASEIRFYSSAPEVMGDWDPLRLEQVVGNLVANALKFGAHQPIDVSVSAVDGRARLVVRDRGIGISPEDAERIFRPYERAAAAKGFGGFGLGLYVTKQIVDAHGGTIVVHSGPEGGSTFEVELPVAPPVTERHDLAA